MCVLADHQPVNHQEIERLDIGEITEGITVNTVNRKEHCAQTIISELEDPRAQITSPESNTVVVEARKAPTRNKWYISRKRQTSQMQDH